MQAPIADCFLFEIAVVDGMGSAIGFPTTPLGTATGKIEFWPTTYIELCAQSESNIGAVLENDVGIGTLQVGDGWAVAAKAAARNRTKLRKTSDIANLLFLCNFQRGVGLRACS